MLIPILPWFVSFWTAFLVTKAGLWICWALYITRWFNNFFNNGPRAIREPDMPLMSTIPCASRYDGVSWPKISIYLQGIFLFPARLVKILGWIVVGGITSFINRQINGIGELGDEQTSRFWWWQRACMYLISRPIIFTAGFTNFSRKQHKVSDFLADYIKYEEKLAGRRAPIQICNHFSLIDVFFHLSNFNGLPCFLAMESVANMPVIGYVAKIIQAVFVKRGDPKSAQWTLDRITERCKLIMDGHDFPAMLIYPEGTINNGVDLMHFKKGAFADGMPLKIFYAETWGKKGTEPTWNLLTELESMFLLFTGHYGITIHEFDNFDPSYSLEKRGITIQDDNAWE